MELGRDQIRELGVESGEEFFEKAVRVFRRVEIRTVEVVADTVVRRVLPAVNSVRADEVERGDGDFVTSDRFDAPARPHRESRSVLAWIVTRRPGMACILGSPCEPIHVLTA